jgi:large subunit ribosomal protein L32e
MSSAKADTALVKRSRKPKFRRPESWRYVRLKPNWRKPKGIDHKVRLSMKGSPPLVKVGYRSPSATRGIHPSGFREARVENPSQLKGLDPTKVVVRIGSTVGRRKRAEILATAKEMGLRVLNPGRLAKK